MLVALAVFASFTAAGLDPAGAMVAGAAVGAVGLAFLGVGLLVAQLMGTSRGANGFSAALVVLAYILRGIGDATGTPDAGGTVMTAGPASWFSPIGWGQQTFAFTGDRWWPLLLPLALAAASLGAAWVLLERRDRARPSSSPSMRWAGCAACTRARRTVSRPSAKPSRKA